MVEPSDRHQIRGLRPKDGDICPGQSQGYFIADLETGLTIISSVVFSQPSNP